MKGKKKDLFGEDARIFVLDCLTYVCIFVLGFLTILLGFGLFNFYYDNVYEGSTDVIVYTNETYHTHTETIKEIVISNETRTYYEYLETIQFYPRKHRDCGRRAYEETITGQSMLPLVSVDDVGVGRVLVEPVSFAELELGDVIIYEKNSSRVFHAVTYINANYLLTAGYNNVFSRGEKVYPPDVVARYCDG